MSLGRMVHTPTVTPQREFPEKTHVLPDAPEELKREFRLLAQEAIILVTRGSSNLLRGVDDWMDFLRSEGFSWEGNMERLLVASRDDLRKIRIYEMSFGHDDKAERWGSLASRFGELHGCFFKPHAPAPVTAGGVAPPSTPKATVEISGRNANSGTPEFWRARRSEFDALATRQRSVLGQDTHNKWLKAYCSFSNEDGKFGRCRRRDGLDARLISDFDDVATQAACALGCPPDVEPAGFWLFCLAQDLLNATEPEIRKEFSLEGSGAVTFRVCWSHQRLTVHDSQRRLNATRAARGSDLQSRARKPRAYQPRLPRAKTQQARQMRVSQMQQELRARAPDRTRRFQNTIRLQQPLIRAATQIGRPSRWTPLSPFTPRPNRSSRLFPRKIGISGF
jgi:hypothetical protein